MSDTKEREQLIEDLRTIARRDLAFAPQHIPGHYASIAADLIESQAAQLAAAETSPPAQPADQQTHNVEDSPEYRLGFAAGRESYARHYKCGCTAFPADAPAYCPIHDGTTKQEQQNGL